MVIDFFLFRCCFYGSGIIGTLATKAAVATGGGAGRTPASFACRLAWRRARPPLVNLVAMRGAAVPGDAVTVVAPFAADQEAVAAHGGTEAPISGKTIVAYAGKRTWNVEARGVGAARAALVVVG